MWLQQKWSVKSTNLRKYRQNLGIGAKAYSSTMDCRSSEPRLGRLTNEPSLKQLTNEPSLKQVSNEPSLGRKSNE